MSFGHHFQTGNAPQTTVLTNRFPSLGQTWIFRILYGSFNPSDFQKLVNPTILKASGSDDSGDLKNLRDLQRSLIWYSQIVCLFAHPNIEANLQGAFADYQLLLIEKIAAYTLSVKAFHSAFVSVRLPGGQDDHNGYRIKDTALMDSRLMKHKRTPNTASASRQQRS